MASPFISVIASVEHLLLHACIGCCVAGCYTLFAGRSIDRERRRYSIGPAPASIESHAGVTASGGDASVVAQVSHGYIRATLRFRAIPKLGNSLSIGISPGQRPIGDGRRAGVIDGDSASKASLPLARYRIANVACKAGRDRTGNSQVD